MENLEFQNHRGFCASKVDIHITWSWLKKCYFQMLHLSLFFLLFFVLPKITHFGLTCNSQVLAAQPCFILFYDASFLQCWESIHLSVWVYGVKSHTQTETERPTTKLIDGDITTRRPHPPPSAPGGEGASGKSSRPGKFYTAGAAQQAAVV